MESTTPIVFYDIAFRPPFGTTCCAPNPWKSRYALNFKNVPYTTSWVPLPDIPKVRSAVGAAAMRKFADGSDFYTLPVLTDSTTNSILGDSFDIAVHLQKTYPNSGGNLFPDQSITKEFAYVTDIPLLIPLSVRNVESIFAEYERFNNHVDAAMTAHVQLMVQGFPFDPSNAEEIKALFVRRAGVSSWNDILVTGENREKLKASLRDTLVGLAKLFERDGSGPFLLGKQPCYADLIVGAWLMMMHRTLPENEWKEVSAWHGGVFGKLHQGLEPFTQAK